MGLGPSTKMTTLHHYRCPVTKALIRDRDVSVQSLIVNGVSERYDDKVFTAVRTGELAEGLHADGAIVVTDGWGNHHIDFVTVIEELGKRGIPSVGMSYIGQQGRLVCTNGYTDMLVDFNKNTSGYESSIVGDNNLEDYDAFKALGLLKLKLKREGIALKKSCEERERRICIRRCSYPIKTVAFGDVTAVDGALLTIRTDIGEIHDKEREFISEARVHIIKPGERHVRVHTNLDFMPVACKTEGTVGEGRTILLDGVTAMLTGGEADGAYEPHNIGSSEGFLDEAVRFDRSGTPAATDILLHIDVTFEPAMGSTVEAIRSAHRLADRVLNEVRAAMKNLIIEDRAYHLLENRISPQKANIIVVKIVSGLGNMYETAVFPFEPAGIIGAKYLMDMSNIPVHITPFQCLDGAVHSLL